jgi:uncharacterized tellurite resistance protein B-like protein
MFGWFLKHGADRKPSAIDALVESVRDELPGADAETLEVVVALAGLLAAVAYADLRYSDEENRRVRAELARLDGMTDAGADAICGVLSRHAREFSAVGVPTFCRSLVDLADRDLRIEILSILIDLAAADGVIATPESNLLRLATRSLGLSQAEYNTAQSRHADKLGVLGRLVK